MESLRYQLEGFGYATSLSSSFWKVFFVVLEKNLFSNNLMIGEMGIKVNYGDRIHRFLFFLSLIDTMEQLLVTQNTNTRPHHIHSPL